MKYKVVTAPGADAKAKEIYGYLKERFGKKSAANFKTTFGKIVKALRHTPHMYEAVPEMPGVRKCAALSPTLVLYQVFEAERRVEILVLYDGRYQHD